MLEIFCCVSYFLIQEVISVVLLLKPDLILAFPYIIDVILASRLILVSLYSRNQSIISLIIRYFLLPKELLVLAVSHFKLISPLLHGLHAPSNIFCLFIVDVETFSGIRAPKKQMPQLLGLLEAVHSGLILPKGNQPVFLVGHIIIQLTLFHFVFLVKQLIYGLLHVGFSPLHSSVLELSLKLIELGLQLRVFSFLH